ncbi:siderophore-interacting protein [Bergeyella zoohelcum]|uniref:Vibriobactin utilization protein ViuB n=1 Tax=Bergeyella zoohelcum TaxID=1015 RepID=A0A7Z8YQ02_9FLAO|nr:siderophore-interacting protein [Bergeyella zoohelcum]VDH04966.1 Vibriobactin utilization protein ViuB [Bergeyella zoohelcum]
MPSVPKWMANAMEALFSGSYLPVTVSKIQMLTPHFKQICFEGNLQKTKKQFIPGNIIEFRVNDTQFRHYTPSYFNHDKGICEIIFYLHQQGEGSQWATKLQTGDELKLIGPGGKISYDPQADLHFVFGDETAIGLMNCLAKTVQENKKNYYCLAELDAKNKEIIPRIDFELNVCEKSHPKKANPAIVKINELLKNYKSQKEKIAFYLVGNAKSIVNVRKNLIEQNINHKKQIQTEPYWVEGKKGL